MRHASEYVPAPVRPTRDRAVLNGASLPDRSFADALFWARELPARRLRRLERQARRRAAPNNYPANRTLAALRAALSERDLSPKPDRLWRRLKKGGAR